MLPELDDDRIALGTEASPLDTGADETAREPVPDEGFEVPDSPAATEPDAREEWPHAFHGFGPTGTGAGWP